MSDEGAQATTLPLQCDNSVIELSPIVYIAVGTNYTNCTLRGQVGTVIQGAMDRLCDQCHGPDGTGPSSVNSGVTTLSGSMVLDRVSLTAATLQIKGDEIIVRDSNISTYHACVAWGDVFGFGVLGGRVTFEGTHVRSLYYSKLINTTMTFFNSDVSPWNGSINAAVDISGATISLENSSIYVADDQRIAFKSSIVNLSNSTFLLGHGAFVLTDSNATFTRSGVNVLMGSQGMRIGNSSVVADCDPSDKAVFGIGQGNNGPGISIDSSRITFHKCSCDISNAIKITGADTSFGGIRIEKSSVHFEGCMAPEPEFQDYHIVAAAEAAIRERKIKQSFINNLPLLV